MECYRDEQEDQRQKAQNKASPSLNESTENGSFCFTTTKDDKEDLRGHIDVLNDYILRLSKENTAATEEYAKLAKENAQMARKYAKIVAEQSEWGTHHARRSKEVADEKWKLAESLKTISQLKEKNASYLEEAMNKDRRILQQESEIEELKFAKDDRAALLERIADLEQQLKDQQIPKTEAKPVQVSYDYPLRQPSYSRYDTPMNTPKTESRDHDRIERSYYGTDCYRPVSDPRPEGRNKNDHSLTKGSWNPPPSKISGMKRSPPRGPSGRSSSYTKKYRSNGPYD